MAVTKPNLVHLPHPLTTAGRRVVYEDHLRNETLGGYLRRLQIEVDRGPLAVCVNGKPVADWRGYRLRRGDYVEVRAVVQGGGGARKVLRTVAMVALVVTAAAFGPAVGGVLGFSTQMGAMAAGTGLIMLGGSMLVNALLPPPMPEMPSLTGRGDASFSQNYALSGARNRARVFAPMPLVIGQRRFVPDAGGNPFTEFAGQDQYLYQVYHFGLQPDLQLSDFRIGDTPIGNYQGVEVMHAGQDGRLPPVFANVNTETGREVRNADGWVVRTLARDTVGIGVDLQGVAYYANDRGEMESRSVKAELQYRQLPDGMWQAYGGDPRGQYALNGNGITPVRQTLMHGLPSAQYEIRVRKTSGDISSSRERNEFALAGLRAYRQDTTSYAGQRRVGLKIKASSQLNGAVDELSAYAVASCPVWTGSAWVTQPTTNPAWWFLWWARGAFDGQGRRMYGGGLPDARIDIDGIKAWAAWCDAKKLSVGLVLDRAYSIADVLTLIARCGRGRYTWQSGRLGVIWDAANLPVVAVFGPANIRAGSFRIEYSNDRTADEVIVNFSNRDKGYAVDQVRVPVPGVLTPTNPVTLDFVGCCDADMAGREANLIAASQLYHRRRVSWETDFEGLVATRGDVVLLSHDLASWSYSGRLLGGARGQLKLDQAVPLGGSAWVGIRFPDGRYATYRVKPGSGASDTLQLRDLIPASDAGGPLPVPDESPDAVPYDWLWFYDAATQPGRRVKIVDVKPAGDGVKFTAIDDRPEYYAAEAGQFASGGAAPSLPPALGFLRLSESSRLTGDGRRVSVVTAVWPPLRGAINYQLKYRRAGGAWAAVVVPDAAYSWDVDPQDLEVSVSAVLADGTLSAPAVASLKVQGHAVPPPRAAAFQATGELMQITLRWSYPDRADLRGVQIDASTDGKTWARLVELAYPTIVWTHLGLAIGATVQYQLRLVDTWGNVGDPVAASATVVQDNDILLGALKGAIDKGQLADSLRQPLERLPELDAAVQSAQQLGSQALNAAMQRVLETDWVDAENKQRFAVVRQDIKKVQDDAQQEVTARLQLAAKLDSTQAGLEDEKKARADAVSAVASSVESLAAKTDKSIAGVRVEIKAAADQAGAVSGRLEEFKSQTAQNLAGVSQQIKSATDAQSATSQKLESYQAQTAQQIAGVRNDISAATGPDSALVRDMQQRIAKSQADAVASANSLTEQRTGPGSALSQSIQQLGSRVGTSETSIQQQAQTINGLMGQWSVKIDRVQNGIAYSSGVVLNNGANGSAFAVLADKFYVALPDASGARQVFTVGSINGRPAVGISGDLIADGTISGRRVIASESIDAGQINSRGLTIKDNAGNVVVSMDGMGAGYIRGKLNVGQIDTEGLRITRNGATVVDATGMDGAYVRNLMVDTLQIKGEAVTKSDTRTISVSGWVNTFDYWFSFYCSDAGTLLCFAEAPPPLNGATLYARDRSVGLSSMSGVIVLSVSAGETVRLGCRASFDSAYANTSLRYGCVLFRR
ncbi:DUF1983 domain-containing protein [Chromobacterium phragmitis]|uniref:host specificity factor TipJ family phage tail protein n=5 Tax=Chromobacterium amazonense TaxID=1382803 RepID=UPI0021B82030|nr:host specificity factor TipJ family phage tail protein [Chromobacterium amazonense]MBM2884911.1 DUF1983 domain-containing protein [Chromobacterium amazonense]MDE1714742.1 host specificity factor TipJ family phage tail protein [Chromobacterium amazonense]